MKRRTKTIQSNLFFTFSLIIVTVVAVFVMFFYFRVSRLLKEKASETIANLSNSTSAQLDNEIQKLDYLSMSVLYSNLVKDLFITYLDDTVIAPAAVTVADNDSVEDTNVEANIDTNSDTNIVNGENQPKTEYGNNAKKLVDVLFSIIGPNRPVQQIYLYDFQGRVFGTGTDNRQYDLSVEDKPWFNKVMENNGKKYLSVPMKDTELSKFVTHSGSPYFISLCRVFFDNYNTPIGIVEVKQYYDEVLKSIDSSIKNSADEVRIYVYNESGSIIYPLLDSSSEEDSYYIKLKGSLPDGALSMTAVNPFRDEKELLNYRYSNYTGWTTVVVISEKQLLSPVYSFTRIVVFVTLIILLLALGFSFFAARKITVPIARLSRAFKAFNLESPVSLNPPDLTSELSELADLNIAFHKMNIKLKNSHDELMLSQQHELQSRMLALQSQMNPHFLFNTLATISVMAEESMDEQIVEMCGYVSDMLRYISSDKSQVVKLCTEIEYTEKYLACMKIRYGGKINYSIKIDGELADIKIPKLVIQPLVENALKYGIRSKPPWNISIDGKIVNGFWQVSVQDNGPGFDPDNLDILWGKIEEINRSGLLPNLELEGMGLLNIYMRLKLSYKDQMVFQIAEGPAKGAVITIGGKI